MAKKTLKKKSKARQVLRKVRATEAEIAQGLRDINEKVRQLECLTEFAALLNSTLDTKEVREKALEATCTLIGCETASLYLIDKSTAELYWETALGDVGKELQKSVRLPINDRSIAGYVAMTGESLIINDVARDPRHAKKIVRKAKKPGGFQARSMLVVPLFTKGHIVGVLQAINRLSRVDKRKKKEPWPHFDGDDLRLLLTLSHQVAIAIENAQLYAELKTGFYETVEALSEAIEKKDRYTGGHTKRVVHYSVCISKYMDLTAEQRDIVKLGAILHDVGKIGIEDKILKKPAPLDPYEWPVMKTHPELGYQIMKRVTALKDVVGGMRYHHERWDGKGYPLGLKGDEIPLLARVIAIADTYDAMVSTRPYRKGLDPKIAFDEIVKNSGTQFCPRTVEAFVLAFQNEKMGKGSGHGKPASPKLATG